MAINKGSMLKIGIMVKNKKQEVIEDTAVNMPVNNLFDNKYLLAGDEFKFKFKIEKITDSSIVMLLVNVQKDKEIIDVNEHFTIHDEMPFRSKDFMDSNSNYAVCLVMIEDRGFPIEGWDENCSDDSHKKIAEMINKYNLKKQLFN